MTPNKPSKSEDEYFAKEEAELLKQQREQARQAADEAARKAHYMKCPKDGHDMEQVTFHDVTVERCLHCHGIFLDADEIAAITRHADATLLGRVVRDLAATFRGIKTEPK